MTDMTDLIPVKEESFDLIPRGGLEEVIQLRFQAGLDQLKIDPSILERQKEELVQKRNKDCEAHQALVMKEKETYVKNNGWWQRTFGKAKFIPPILEPSLSTKMYDILVKLGETFFSHLNNLKKFTESVETMRKQYKDLSLEGAELTTRINRLNGQQTLREEAYETTSELVRRLADYDTMNLEEREEFEREIQNFYDNLPVKDDSVRELFCQKLYGALFMLDQQNESYQTDLQMAQMRATSVEKQIAAIKRDGKRVWEIFNPARLKAMELYSTYQELSSSAERGVVLNETADIILGATQLCMEAQKIAEELEYTLVGKLEVINHCQQLE